MYIHERPKTMTTININSAKPCKIEEPQSLRKPAINYQVRFHRQLFASILQVADNSILYTIVSHLEV